MPQRDLFLHIIPRKKAKELGLTYYFTGSPCKRSHISKRDTIKGCCYECKLEHGRKTPISEHKKAYMKKYLSTYTPKNRKEQQRRYYDENRTKELERSKVKRIKNQDYYKAKCAERRALKKKAKPKWFNPNLVNKIYKMGGKLSLEVDHIVPLQSDFVCGLHSWENLQLLDRKLNAEKLNILWVDMPDTSDPELLEMVRNFKNELI